MIICRLGNNVIRNEANVALRNISQTSQQLDITKEKEADTFGTLNQSRNELKSKKNLNTSSQFSKKQSHRNYGVQDHHPVNARNNLPDQVNTKNNWHGNKTLEKWSDFREADYQKILKQSRNLLQDDDDDDFNYLFGEKKKDSEKDSEKDLELNGIENQKSGTSENDINKFGTLDITKYDHEKFEGDEGDAREEKFQKEDTGRKDTPQFYGKKIRKLCKENKLAEAIKLLEEDMINDGVKPNEYCYQILINACGRVGYTQKAFSLYNQMKKRGLKPHHVSYTGLFDACANSPWKTTDGLKRATKLKQQLDEAGYLYNQIVSHAMIKAFGRCGDTERAFEIVDEMLASGLVIDIRTISTLLQACISDKESGFRHALLAWRKMRELKIDPNIYTYNLLVHCAKECKGGDIALASKLLELPSGSRKTKRKEIKTEKVILLEDTNLERTENDILDNDNKEISTNDIKLSDQSENRENLKHSPSSVESRGLLVSPSYKEIEMPVHEVKSDSKELLPQLLARKPTKGSVIGLTTLDEPQHRLALLGGSVGLLKQMRADKVMPDLKTFTQLIGSLPPTQEAELALLNSMKNIGLSPDTQFCNMLIRKRSFRFDKAGAEAILDVMSEYKLSPDLITFGCLALCCYDAHSTRNLLQSMDDAGCIPNATIMTSLLRNCLKLNNYFFAVDLLLEMQQRKIEPEAIIVKHLEKARREARKTLLQLEETSRLRKLTQLEKKNQDGSRLFLMEWKNYLVSSSTSDLHDHPWAQYNRTKPDDIRM